MIDAEAGRFDNTGMKSPVAMPSSAVSRNALGVIATVAAGAAIYWLRDILTPLAMAIFLLIMIDGVKRSVEARTPLTSRMAGIAALTLVVLAFFASIAIIVNGAAGFFGEASGVSQNIGPRIDQIIRDVYGIVRLANPPTAQDLINGIDVRGYLTSMAFQVQGIASGAFFVLIYLAFSWPPRSGSGARSSPCSRPRPSATRPWRCSSACAAGSRAISGCSR